MAICLHCGTVFEARRSTAQYCGDRCREAARYLGARTVPAIGPKRPSPVSPTRQGKNGIILPGKSLKTNAPVRAKIRSPETDLRFERVNAVTWKLTAGETIRVAAVHGHWGGYNATEAVAWVIDVGWPGGSPGWVARFRNLSYGPTTIMKAKQAALAMIDSSFEAPVAAVSDPTDWLGRHAARAIDDNGGSPVAEHNEFAIA